MISPLQVFSGQISREELFLTLIAAFARYCVGITKKD
jgi:hypothetical protein